MQIWWTKFDTHTVLSRDKVLISLFLLFILLQVLLCSRKYMKLPKFGILVNKTTYLFTSIREQYFQGVCKNFGNSGEEKGGGGKFWGLILENPEGRGSHTPSVRVVRIFSGTTQCFPVALAYLSLFHTTRPQHLVETFRWKNWCLFAGPSSKVHNWNV